MKRNKNQTVSDDQTIRETSDEDVVPMDEAIINKRSKRSGKRKTPKIVDANPQSSVLSVQPNPNTIPSPHDRVGSNPTSSVKSAHAMSFVDSDVEVDYSPESPEPEHIEELDEPPLEEAERERDTVILSA